MIDQKQFIHNTIMELKKKPSITKRELQDITFDKFQNEFPILIDEELDSFYQYICEVTQNFQSE